MTRCAAGRSRQGRSENASSAIVTPVEPLNVQSCPLGRGLIWPDPLANVALTVDGMADDREQLACTATGSPSRDAHVAGSQAREVT
jgi:hypothetical protein